ncbi:unnamed protein product [Mytilus edulis]|uniref:BTB domain-containing protein n=1 Tax=Mytilus edulis TaxID=6550 RepID=A0A8S3R4Z1_MYTED|nr:unnamed protein product [Mytilus edulis]
MFNGKQKNIFDGNHRNMFNGKHMHVSNGKHMHVSNGKHMNMFNDFSSGYDSPVHISDKDSNRNCQRRLQIEQSSDDSDFSSDESTPLEYSSSEDDDIGDDDDTDSVESMKGDSEHSKQVVFCYVSETCKRSHETDEEENEEDKAGSTDQNNRLTIIIDNYDADIFHTFLLFVHCGSIVMEPSSVTGLLCLATEFDIPDLRNACWDFIERCLSAHANTSLLMQDTFHYGDHKAAQKLRLKILRMPSTKDYINIFDTFERFK